MALKIAPLSLEHPAPRQSLGSSPTPSASKAFQALLGKVRESLSVSSPTPRKASAYTVRQGDNLSQICQKAMAQQGLATSPQDIVRAVAAVAKANNIANPDLILIGQSLDLNAISSSQRGEGGPAGTQALFAESGTSARLTRLIQSLYTTASVEKKGQAPDGQGLERMLGAPSEVTSGYGNRTDPFTGRTAYHSGVDLAASTGTTVYPWKTGIVKFSGWQPEYGKIVIVAHDDGAETAYAHNSKNLVKAGDRVEANTRIALLGSTGRSTGPHLHFELRRDGQPVDPASPLQGGSLQIAKAL